jgi:mRNA interferase MazF
MKRGDVWVATLDPVRGSEQAGTRPALVFQADPLLVFLRTLGVIPFTTTLRWGQYSFCVRVPAGDGGLPNDSVALCHQIRACDKDRLIRRLGVLSAAMQANIEQAVRITLGM